MRWFIKLVILEPGTTAILSHDAIMKEMETWCERWKNGEVYRSNEFGIFRLNPRLWSDINPPHHSIAMPIENHAYTRPILDKLLGTVNNSYKVCRVLCSTNLYNYTRCLIWKIWFLRPKIDILHTAPK